MFLVDDHGMFRAGVRSELAGEVNIVGEAADVAPAITEITQCLPDVVLLDVHLPGGGGQDVVAAVKTGHPDVKFLALSASDAPEDVIAVIRAGARGYVTKTISGTELVDAIRRVAAGDAVFSPRLAGFVLDAFAAGTAPDMDRPSFDPELDQLTAREREVLRLIARGYTYREVAQGALHLRQDGGEPRLLGTAQAAAVDPAPAHPLGGRAPAHLASPAEPGVHLSRASARRYPASSPGPGRSQLASRSPRAVNQLATFAASRSRNSAPRGLAITSTTWGTSISTSWPACTSRLYADRSPWARPSRASVAIDCTS